MLGPYSKFVSELKSNRVYESGQLLLPPHKDDPVMQYFRKNKVFNLKGAWYICKEDINTLRNFINDVIKDYGNYIEIHNINTKEKVIINQHKVNVFVVKGGEKYNNNIISNDSLFIEDCVDDLIYIFNMKSPKIEKVAVILSK